MSLMARAASRRILRSGSLRNVAMRGSRSLRIVSTAAMRNDATGSPPSSPIFARSPIQASACTPAWRRNGSLSALTASIEMIEGCCSRAPSLPRARAAKARTRADSSAQSSPNFSAARLQRASPSMRAACARISSSRSSRIGSANHAGSKSPSIRWRSDGFESRNFALACCPSAQMA